MDHYFYHDNTAPFLASRLIQRLITSNPSPRYIEAVVNAFKSGSYVIGGHSFGSNQYGDLAATFSAIYLDREARNVVADGDITSGLLREPILKVLSLMRSMDFLSQHPIAAMNGMEVDIGQMPHEFTSVFSFFLPEFKPYGRIGDANLVSPEATLLDMPKTVGLMNGLVSLVKYGLSSCEGGWGVEYCRERRYLDSPMGRLEFNRTASSEEFLFETFEGPSLVGGFDNTWVGRDFHTNKGISTLDPLGLQRRLQQRSLSDPLIAENHVLSFSSRDWNGWFFSMPVTNTGVNDNLPVVKFRYLSTGGIAGGCIGYVDASRTYLNTQTWIFCDGYEMESNGSWISCQFNVPTEISSFRIVVGDRPRGSGEAFFDDIYISSGEGNTCDGVDVLKMTPPGQEGYSGKVIDKLGTLLTAGRLSRKAKDIITEAFDNAGSADDGLRMAQQLILTTAEFHTTNIVKSTEEERENTQFPEPSNKPYRAILYVMFSGGCDSFNMLTPYTCSNGLYESYLGTLVD